MKTFVSKFAVAALFVTFTSVPALVVTSTSSAFATGCGCSHKLAKAKASSSVEVMSEGGGSIYDGTAGSDGSAMVDSRSKSTGGKSTSSSTSATYNATGNMTLTFGHHGNLKSAEITSSAGGSAGSTANTGN